MSAILIIEDDPIIALSLDCLVDDLGHEVAGRAARTHQALRIANRRPPDLVLADVQLAGGDCGLDTVRQIKHICDASVIFITGHPEQVARETEFRPDGIVGKPFDAQRLRSLITNVLSRRERPAQVSGNEDRRSDRVVEPALAGGADASDFH